MFKDCFSSFVQNVYPQYEQRHLGSVSSAVKHFELSLKCLLNFRVFRVLRFDQQASLKASCLSFWRIAGHPPEPSTPKVTMGGNTET